VHGATDKPRWTEPVRECFGVLAFSMGNLAIDRPRRDQRRQSKQKTRLVRLDQVPCAQATMGIDERQSLTNLPPHQCRHRSAHHRVSGLVQRLNSPACAAFRAGPVE